ncbi:UDP-N-acetylmuramoyl-tripeptide--D-alanyl-D-alanine ligase [Corynebacterium freiburgense]|uniref:UDP-N-acetylmuramoyl-tripeptide--D-alanyl-D- alanine ligase n=1 Tax=Corynebacterium freiburgense TaxID=556548 RepID=UPI00042A2636|nr:UDP-N-acetylmuramoyl-tripeptide--D-alanyl-D-alanine ligase [Corynebacterium freiburgense]WJZ03161.1 UDP-N-acetylmuramoyl-tripeptide--D-alanyl-D-alanine ligase [Corynebacterium freiburgense]
MISMRVGEIAEVVGGTLHNVDPDVVVTGSVEFDSRKVTEGSVFIAFPGARVDGHDFAETAIAQGAVVVLAAREVPAPAILVPEVPRPETNAEAYAHDATGATASVIAALSKLARHIVEQTGVRVIGVTGSAGKTSTKDFLASLLDQAVAPPGSFNNEIGLPYTALRCTNDTKYLVAEMSARGVGHIRHLTEVTPPHIGVVLNVGSAHLGEFGSRETIAEAKGELIEALPADGVAVLNADDPAVMGMAFRTKAKVVRFSTQQEAEYFATDITLDALARPSFVLHTPVGDRQVSLQVHGEHQVGNALAAVGAALEAGGDLDAVVDKLEAHTAASAHRMDVRTRADGVVIINDAYNANPDSMRAGLAALARTAQGRSWAVLGQMGELGAEALDEHRRLADVIVELGIDRLVVVGVDVHAHALAEAAQVREIPTLIADSSDAAINLIAEELQPKDAVLVKASFAEGLWDVATGLIEACLTEK